MLFVCLLALILAYAFSTVFKCIFHMYIYITRHVYIYHNSLKETVQGSKDDGHVIKTTLKVYYKTEGKSLMNGSLYIHVHHKYILICRSKYRLCFKKKPTMLSCKFYGFITFSVIFFEDLNYFV